MSEDVSDEKFWTAKIKQHWKVFAVMIMAAVFAFIGIILVGIWVLEANPFVDPRTGTFNSWTLNYVVGFFILLFLWELLLVGVPSALFFGVGGYIWWSRLPEEEKQEIKERDKKEKSHKAEKYGGGGGGFSFFMFIAYCIYIAIQGNYNTPFGAEPYTYWIYSYMLTFMWIMIVLGVPALLILLIVYLTVWRKK
jgi:hypothetical protein